MTEKRKYTHRTPEERYNGIVKRIETLEAAHNKRYERIGKLRLSAQSLLIKLQAKQATPQ